MKERGTCWQLLIASRSACDAARRRSLIRRGRSRIVVPFAAGGPTDMIARTLGERMRASLGQTLRDREHHRRRRLDRRRARRAGRARRLHASASGNTGTHVVNGAIYPLKFDLLNDLEPLALIATNPMLVVTKNDVPAKNLRELIAWLKANPGKVAAGTAGVGSGSHLAAVYFQTLTGTKFNFVPYRGTGPALQDLVAGQIDMIVDQASNSMAAGARPARSRLTRSRRASACRRRPTSRPPTRPDCPDSTFRSGPRSGLPKGTPKDVIAKLNAAVVDALADPTVRQRFADAGSRNPAARAADAGGARRASQGRDREMVADHQGGEHQGGVDLFTRSGTE